MNSQKKPVFKPKHDEPKKDEFGFVYDERKITDRTQIPQLPEHPKMKPDQKKVMKKIHELKDRAEKLKQQRKTKKEQYKRQTKNIQKKTHQYEENIQIGTKCLRVLREDQAKFKTRITTLGNKIKGKRNIIDKIKNKQQNSKIKKVPLQQMNLQELKATEKELLSNMSTQQLTKKQQAYNMNKINEISRLKLKVQGQENNQKNTKQLQDHMTDLQNLKQQCKRFNQRLQETLMKIQCIQEDLDNFQAKIQEIKDQQLISQTNNLYKQSKQIKEQILTIRKNIAQLQINNQQRHNDYQCEQAKIQWINWANEIQQKYKQQKQLRKTKENRQKVREQTNNKQIQKDKPKYQQQQKTIINQNQNQKQIDVCNQLIKYCQNLKPENSQEAQTTPNISLQSQLSKGEWSNVKGIKVIQPKKTKNNEEPNEKQPKKKKLEKQPISKEKILIHTYYLNQMFDSVKVMPPCNIQDLESTINQLKDKSQYYINHPDKQNSKKINQERGKYTEDKYNNTKRINPKNIINLEDFPTLQ